MLWWFLDNARKGIHNQQPSWCEEVWLTSWILTTMAKASSLSAIFDHSEVKFSVWDLCRFGNHLTIQNFPCEQGLIHIVHKKFIVSTSVFSVWPSYGLSYKCLTWFWLIWRKIWRRKKYFGQKYSSIYVNVFGVYWHMLWLTLNLGTSAFKWTIFQLCATF